MLFLVIFEDDKSGDFLRGDKSFRTLKRTKSCKSRTNDVTSKYHLRHFGTSQKVKTKDVNEYLNGYLNIRMGFRIIFEYSMVINIFPPP